MAALTPNGVERDHLAFACDRSCDAGRVDRGRTPADEVTERCPECDGEGVYLSVDCSGCGDRIAPGDVRSSDNAYAYCEDCTAAFAEAKLDPVLQQLLDSIFPEGSK